MINFFGGEIYFLLKGSILLSVLWLLTLFVISFNSPNKWGRSRYSQLKMREQKLRNIKNLAWGHSAEPGLEPHVGLQSLCLLHYGAGKRPDQAHLCWFLSDDDVRTQQGISNPTSYLPLARRTREGLFCYLFWFILIRTICWRFTDLTLLVLADHFCQGLLDFSNGSLWVLETGMLFWKELFTSDQHLLALFCESHI